MCYSAKLDRFEEKASNRSQVHRGDAVEREETQPDASRVRLLAFFPSRATGSSGKEDDDVILSLFLSLPRFPTAAHYDFPTCCASRHDADSRTEYPRAVNTREVPSASSPSMCNVDYSFVEPQGELVSIFVLECASGDIPAPSRM